MGSGQTKDNEICICCFFVKHTKLRSKSKDWLAQNLDNVSSSEATTCFPVDLCFSELEVVVL